jgi:hypothetical protein
MPNVSNFCATLREYFWNSMGVKRHSLAILLNNSPEEANFTSSNCLKNAFTASATLESLGFEGLFTFF